MTEYYTAEKNKERMKIIKTYYLIDFSVNMNEYLPLRDVVFNTLRQAILKGELKPGILSGF